MSATHECSTNGRVENGKRKKNDVRSKDLFSTLYVQSPALEFREIGVQTGAHEADSDGSKQSKAINKHYRMLDDRKQETTIGREAEYEGGVERKHFI